MKALCLDHVSFGYDEKHNVLDDICLKIDRGAVAAVTGRSGAGKSTLAMAACGVIPKSVSGCFKGSVRVLGEDIADKEIFETAGIISMVFQDPESQLFAPTVADEVAFGPENLCFGREAINDRLADALETVGMEAFAVHPPSMLSGGQQQLIALASILSLGPEVIILDEVAAQVDEVGVALLKDAVKALKRQGKTILIIEHGNSFKALYDEVYVLENGRLSRSGA
ncbi:MAG: energy-coupling factor ABC transporter ATP-binding protein [Christensenellales bacterium]|jgi:energy-coupling factor transport system ATP-binding protein